MQRSTLTADESEFVANLCHYVRAHLTTFKSAGQRLDAKFSAAAFRQRHEALVDAMREARALRFDEELGRQVQTDEPMYGEWAIAQARMGTTPERVGERMARALGEVGNVKTDDALDTALAEEVCVLTWLAWDEHAHLLSPRICEFQSMDWGFDPLHTDCNRRQLHKEHVSSAWVALARKSLSLAGLRPLTAGLVPPSGQSASSPEDQLVVPPSELWLRNHAPSVRRSLEVLAPLIAHEEQQLRRLWFAQRMIRVRHERDELRQHLRFHPNAFPPVGMRSGVLRQRLRVAHRQPEDHATAIFWSVREALERERMLYAKVPFPPSFAAWVEFLMLVVFDARVEELPRISALQELSNEWPGRPRLQMDLRHSELLDPFLQLAERAWTVAAPMLAGSPETPVEISDVGRKPQVALVGKYLRWTQVQPEGMPLTGWNDIAAALQARSGRAFTNQIKSWAEKFGGPIKYLGRRPVVDRGQLRDWIAEIGDGASQTAETQRHSEFIAKDLEARNGADLSRQGLHTKRTRRKP